MISFGAVPVEGNLSESFYGQCRPLPEANWVPEALAVSGHSREEVLGFEKAEAVMQRFVAWVDKVAGDRRPMFVADNNGFDWQFFNYYCHRFTHRNPFGYSSTNLNSLYKGLRKNLRTNIRHLRDTKHTHHPVDDARGNAEAFLKVMEMMRLP